ncbi:helix-turn-helix domain-containing protein [Streptococcus pluranimalium]|uniref:XRE family transcriptional regulator n=1 Tax=Streptococcus pluranimalium TaxID=82348 RepID=A0A2L0D6F9_9STRE|nr:helix-turn-helix transcriptional regulator [Streptococcus pluranimalium]AUW97240.1 XRE family transcriptional regulator [Streptococcus pluranimalium]
MFSEKRLKERRTALGYSQSQIANYLGINRASYNQWESGKTKPNQKNLELVSDYLGVEKAYFESEYPIVSSYLQLTPVNQKKLEDYANVLLDVQNRVIERFPIQVINDIRLSAGSGEMVGDEYARLVP